ncbi:MAG TPA: hypothetical protein VGO58_12470 [Chitinophagaceae bacterium]|jgi:hypothetical protein|nr:hypothetical protein [Chitinophagaceae bacterium]
MITNTVIYKDSLTTREEKNNGRYNGVITDNIISCLPLALHKNFVTRCVNPGKRYMEYDTEISVEAREELDIPGLGKLDCWRIRTLAAGQVIEEVSVNCFFSFLPFNSFMN